MLNVKTRLCGLCVIFVRGGVNNRRIARCPSFLIGLFSSELSVVVFSSLDKRFVVAPPPVGGSGQADGETDGDVNGDFLLEDTSDRSDSHCAFVCFCVFTGDFSGLFWWVQLVETDILFDLSTFLQFLMQMLRSRDAQPIRKRLFPALAAFLEYFPFGKHRKSFYYMKKNWKSPKSTKKHQKAPKKDHNSAAEMFSILRQTARQSAVKQSLSRRAFSSTSKRSVHFKEGPYENIPFRVHDRKIPFAVLHFSYFGLAFAIPFVAVYVQLKRSGAF